MTQRQKGSGRLRRWDGSTEKVDGGNADSSVIVFVQGWGEMDKGIPVREWYRLNGRGRCII